MSLSIKYWSFDPVIISMIVILCFLYLYLQRGKLSSKSFYFFAALFLIVLSTFSPLHWFGEYYLFSAHMITHVTLFLVVSPLLLISLPSLNSPSRLKLKKISKAIAKVPWIAWVLGIGIMWFWHIPAVFDAAMPSHVQGGSIILHQVQNVSLIIVGLLFWWPVLGPYPYYRLPVLTGVLYLFTACIGCSLLGLLITFSPAVLYSYYLNVKVPAGMMRFGNNGRMISPIRDQQMAGLIMWVPGCLIYVTMALYLMRKWFVEKEEVSITSSFFNLKNKLYEKRK